MIVYIVFVDKCVRHIQRGINHRCPGPFEPRRIFAPDEHTYDQNQHKWQGPERIYYCDVIETNELIGEREQQLCAIRCATVEQRVRKETQIPRDVPQLKTESLFEDEMRNPGKRNSEQQVHKHAVAVAPVNLQFGDLICKQRIEQNIEIGNSAGNGTNQLAFITNTFSEHKFSNGCS